GDIIHALCDVQRFNVVRKGGLDFVHLVGHVPVQDGYGEPVSHLQLVQVGEHLGLDQSVVGGEDAVGAGAAGGQAGAQPITGSGLQLLLLGALINGQLHVDFGNADVAHHAVAQGVEQT